MDSVLRSEGDSGPPESSLESALASNEVLAPKVPDPDLRYRPRMSWHRIAGLTLLGIGVIAGTMLTFKNITASRRQTLDARLTQASQRIKPQAIPLSDLTRQLNTVSPGQPQLSVNGQLNLNGSLVLQPASRPANAIAGQVYYDQAGSQILYYNGTKFISLQGGSNTQIANNITNITGGAGNVTAVNGAAGSIALFSGGSSIGNSLLTQSGAQVLVSGTLSATTLQGNGSGITNLNASNLASGTVADARLTPNVTLQGSTFNGVNELVQLNGIGGLPALDGSLLTNLNATDIASGTLSDSRLSPNVTLLDANDTFTGDDTFKNAANSTSAFQVQNANGDNLFTVDTTDNELVLGKDATGSPTALTIRGGAAVGNNLIGGNLILQAPDGTGVGGSGDFVFDTAGGVSNPLVTVDTSSGSEEASTANNATLTWSHTTGTQNDRIMVVAVDTAQPFSPSPTPPATAATVTYNGVPLTELVSVGSGAEEAYGSVWYLVNPPSGAHNVSVTFTGAASDIGAESTTLYNVNTSSPFATFTTNQVDAGTISTTLDGTDSGDGILDAIMSRADWTLPTPGANQTLLYSHGAAGEKEAGSFRQGQSDSTTMSWTGSGSSEINQVVMALSPEPNLTPDPLSEAFRITQSGTLGVDLGANETALSTLSFGGGANRTIAVNQNPGSGNGHNLTLQAGGGAVGSNNGGNLLLQGGLATGSGAGGSVIVEPQTDSTTAFEILQQSSGAALLTADSSNLVITVSGAASSAATLALTNAHFESTQTTAPTVGTPTNCGTGPSATITAGSTDSAGSFTITAGTGSPTTCNTILTFNKPYASTPKTIILTPTALAGSTSPLAGWVFASSTASFTTQIAPTNPASGGVYSYYYWVVE